MFKKENDWWVESGGPPVTNEGKIATDLDLDQYPEKTEDQFLCEALKSFMKIHTKYCNRDAVSQKLLIKIGLFILMLALKHLGKIEKYIS